MAKKKARPARKPWTAADLKALKKLSGKTSTVDIAKQLGRTAGAVQQKAMNEGISLALKKRK
jgi:hypothetical protein